MWIVAVPDPGPVSVAVKPSGSAVPAATTVPGLRLAGSCSGVAALAVADADWAAAGAQASGTSNATVAEERRLAWRMGPRHPRGGRTRAKGYPPTCGAGGLCSPVRRPRRAQDGEPQRRRFGQGRSLGAQDDR